MSRLKTYILARLTWVHVYYVNLKNCCVYFLRSVSTVLYFVFHPSTSSAGNLHVHLMVETIRFISGSGRTEPSTARQATVPAGEYLRTESGGTMASCGDF